MHLETLNAQPASILGLAGSQGMDTSCAAVAFEAGVNYFFFYDVSHENLLNGLKPIVATHREQVLIATGSEERDKGRLRQYLEQVRRYLGEAGRNNAAVACLDLGSHGRFTISPMT